MFVGQPEQPILNSSIQQSNRRFACPDEEVVFDCSAPTNGTLIQWIIPPFVNETDPITLIRSDVEKPRVVRSDGAIIALVADVNPLRSFLIVSTQDLANMLLDPRSNMMHFSTNVTCVTNDGASVLISYEVAGMVVVVHMCGLMFSHNVSFDKVKE